MPSTLRGPIAEAPAGSRSASDVFADYGWCSCLFLPLSNMAFLAGGPYSWQAALLWTSPVWCCILLDWLGPAVDYRPPRPLSSGVYLGLLHGLALLQLVGIFLLVQMASQLTWGSPAEWGVSLANLIAMRIVTGTTSCCSGIALAHELIHRRGRWLRGLGRVLLWTVLYDHFTVAHVCGHHRHAATRRDYATARQGESFAQFWRRSVPGQWGEAWRHECARLRAKPVLRRWLGNRLVQGSAIQGTLLASIALLFGPVALAIFVYQAVVAVRLLEAVNYVQHWGLQRDGSRLGPAQAWSTRSWWSLNSLLGLPLHADHHCNAGNPFHRLVALDGSPQLPYGYFVMAVMVRVANDDYQRLAEKRLHC
jgi:alkane 1-monooxygenase